jgi:hypothetical protein
LIGFAGQLRAVWQTNQQTSFIKVLRRSKEIYFFVSVGRKNELDFRPNLWS